MASAPLHYWRGRRSGLFWNSCRNIFFQKLCILHIQMAFTCWKLETNASETCDLVLWQHGKMTVNSTYWLEIGRSSGYVFLGSGERSSPGWPTSLSFSSRSVFFSLVSLVFFAQSWSKAADSLFWSTCFILEVVLRLCLHDQMWESFSLRPPCAKLVRKFSTVFYVFNLESWSTVFVTPVRLTLEKG